LEGQQHGDHHVGIAGTAEGFEGVVASEDSGEGRRALREAFGQGAAALYRFILVRVAGNRDAADELLQQTCYEAARGQAPGQRDECEAWLRGIARNLIRRHWRRARKDAGRAPLEDSALASRLADDLERRPLPVDALIEQETVEQLLLAITGLPTAEQELIFAFYFDGRSQAAIARERGVSEKSIESRLYRARGRLRAALRGTERSGER
jgi:RNA polymerase sigma-70 factor (ECF subfamily)